MDSRYFHWGVKLTGGVDEYYLSNNRADVLAGFVFGIVIGNGGGTAIRPAGQGGPGIPQNKQPAQAGSYEK